jgi:hypothetical protein
MNAASSAKCLLPGTYKLNPHAFEIKIVKMVEIEPGHVGVIAARSGKTAKGQLAEEGERGVQKRVLEPGLYAINPEAYSVESIEIGFNQITMAHAGKLPETLTTGQGADKARGNQQRQKVKRNVTAHQTGARRGEVSVQRRLRDHD